MKLSLLWLQENLFPTIKKSEICDQLNKIGLEVNLINPKKYFKKSIIGVVLKITLVEKKNHLLLLKIQLKKNIFIKVFSENKNFYIGMKLAVGIKKKTFKKKIIKKKIFEGIIYKYSDFKLFGNKNSIVEFPKYEVIGQSVEKYFKKNPDIVLKINVPANRLDCLGVFGIIRELSVLNNYSLKFNFHVLNNIHKQKITKEINLSFIDKKICSNYFIKIIKNIDVSVKTPFWIREKLRKSRIFSKDIISDIVNYVSLELGQSIHFFDFDTIKNKNISVRLSQKNEKIQLKNNFFLDIYPNTAIISSESEILSLGGYIHSEKFLINKFTKNLYLGGVIFYESIIDKIKRKYNQYYCSYDKYYRKCEEKICLLALERISILIKELCGGTIKYIHYSHINLNKNNKIDLFYNKINKLLGFIINKYLIINILKKLEYHVYEKLYILEILPPYFRSDILFSEDVISDIIRFYGYNKIFSIPINSFSMIPQKNIIFHNLFKIKNFLCNNKYLEVINYSFTNLSFQKLFFQDREVIKIINPISKDFLCMRKSLFPGLLKNIKYNINRQEKNFRIFESGLCFFKNLKKNSKINQILMLSGVISGYKYNKNFFYENKKFSFYDLKNDIENFLHKFYDIREVFFKKEKILGFDENICSVIYYKNIKIGCAGMFHHSIKNIFNLSKDIFAFEIFVKKLPKNINYKIQEFFPYPHSERDISIIVSKNVPVAKILSTCYKISYKHIFFVKIFDIYYGKKIPKNKKSLSIKIFFKNDKKNFTHNEIQNLFYLCIQKLQKKFNAILRDK